MRKNLLIVGIITLTALIVLATGCGSSSSGVANNKPEKPAKTSTVVSGSAGNGMTVSLANSDGLVHRGQQDFTMTFFDKTGKAANVTSASIVFKIGAFGSTPEDSVNANFVATGTPGSFRGKFDLMRVGEWEAQIDYNSADGKGSLKLPIVVK